MILVTGATGKVGKELVADLKARGAEFKVMSRDPIRAASQLGGVSVVSGDLARPESFGAVLAGVEKAFLLAATDPAQAEREKGFITAAKKAGVRHIVKLSVAGAAADGLIIGRWHAEAESALKASGLAWTMLQPVFFHQNFFGDARSIKEQGSVYAPMASAKVAMVDTRDIAAAAALALTKPGHEGKSYVLSTGALSYGDAVTALSEALGKTVSYVDVPPEKARESMLAGGMPAWYADALLELFAAVREGRISQTSPDCETLLGRAPISFARFAADYKAAFN